MTEYEALMGTLALTLGVAWASGINLYAAVAALGIAGSLGYVDLPPGLAVVQDPLVIGVAVLMYAVEFFVDKTPGVDTGWDALHTFIRIPAGALLAAGAVGDVNVALQVAAGLVGGTVAGASHLAKASSRALINTSPEPFSNWGASIAEDVAVLGGLWLMFNHPVLFLLALLLFVALLIWLVPKMWRALGRIAHRISRWLGKRERAPAQPQPDDVPGPPPASAAASSPVPPPSSPESRS